MAFSQTYWGILVFAGLLIAMAIAMTAWAFSRYNNLRILSGKPVKATARLLKKSGRKQFALIAELTQTPVVYYIRYEFKDSRGKAYTGSSQVTKEIFDTIQPTSGIEVVYDHDNPVRNFLESSLEHEKFKYLMLSLIGAIVIILVPFLVMV